jgi:acyl-CoA thioesterase-1
MEALNQKNDTGIATPNRGYEFNKANMMMKNILFFGDSLTAGYGLHNVSLESLPALIQDKINSEKLPFKVINAGLSGETSAGGLARIDLFLDQQFDIFVLELGANDILRGISSETTHKNLQEIINKVVAKHPQIKMLLLGMEIPTWLAEARTVPFNIVFRKIAKDNQMALVPFLLDGVAGISYLNLHDGFHPSAEGYRVVAHKIWPQLRQLIHELIADVNVLKH